LSGRGRQKKSPKGYRRRNNKGNNQRSLELKYSGGRDNRISVWKGVKDRHRFTCQRVREGRAGELALSITRINGKAYLKGEKGEPFRKKRPL